MTDKDLIAGLARRVQLQEDIEECRTLRNLYHHYINEGTYGRMRELVTDDAVLHLGYMAHYEGIDAIHRGFCAMADRDRFFIKQYIHGHMVNLDGDKGTGVSYMQAHYGRRGTSYLVTGKYEDVYVRQNGKWLFKKMDFEFYFSLPVGAGWTGDDLHYMRPVD